VEDKSTLITQKKKSHLMGGIACERKEKRQEERDPEISHGKLDDQTTEGKIT